ncbi:PrgI family protein [Patescibacteria group bacterium]|nr:PrgI family protein [Patescibacteria group bacterium]
MEYQVPQFIEAEDKIVGPLTFKQFLYLGGAAGICVISFLYLNILLAVLIALPVIGLAAALAFYKVNGKPFIEVLEAGFNYFIGAKLFLWRRNEEAQKRKQAAAATAAAEAATAAAALPRNTPRLTRGRLSELAWSLDVRDSASNENRS